MEINPIIPELSPRSQSYIEQYRVADIERLRSIDQAEQAELDYASMLETYANRRKDNPLTPQALKWSHHLANTFEAEIAITVQNEVSAALHDVALVQSTVTSPTAIYWILDAAKSNRFPTPLNTALTRWHEETVMFKQFYTLSHLYPGILQSVYFGLRVLYYLMFGDPLNPSPIHQCPYALMAKNFILSLLYTGRCVCLCYTNYVVSAAEECEDVNIRTYNLDEDHAFPVIMHNNTITVGLEAGFRNNDHIRVHYYGGAKDELYSQLRELTINMPWVRLYALSPEPEYNIMSQWNQPGTLIKHLLTKPFMSSDHIIYMSVVILTIFNYTHMLPSFLKVLTDNLLRIKMNSPPTDFLKGSTLISSYEAAYHELVGEIPPHLRNLILDWPNTVAVRTALYERLTHKITLQPYHEGDLEIFRLLPAYDRSLFITTNVNVAADHIVYLDVPLKLNLPEKHRLKRDITEIMQEVRAKYDTVYYPEHFSITPRVHRFIVRVLHTKLAELNV